MFLEKARWNGHPSLHPEFPSAVLTLVLRIQANMTEPLNRVRRAVSKV